MLKPELTIHDYLRILRKRRWIILLTITLVMFFTMIFSSLSRDSYIARTMVLVDINKTVSKVLGDRTFQSTVNLETEEEIVKSTAVMENSALILGLITDVMNKVEKEKVIDELMAMVDTQIITRSNIVSIFVKSEEADLAARIANTVARVYKEEAVLLRTKETREAIEFVKEKLNDYTTRLNNIEDRRRILMKSEGIVDVEMELSSILSRISENQREISSLSTKLDINRSKYELLQRDLAIGKNSSRNNSERFEVIKSSLLEKEMELVRLKRQYTERHPRISTLNEEVSVLKERLKSAKNEGVAEEISELKNEISVFERRLIAHKEIIEKLNQERATLPAKKADITRITGETSILSDLVREFNTKLENLRIIQAEQLSGKMTIIKRASVPRKPIKPYRSMNVLLGSIAGLVLGLFMAFLVESIDVSVSTVEEVETYVNLSVLGLIPYVAVRNQGDEQTFIPDELKTPLPSSRCIAYHEPKSIIAESFRIFRTNLQFSKRKKPNQGIIFTSSLPGEGKTFLAVNTAITYAQLGNKVLLVDMNLRDPEIHDFFGMSKNPGVTDILIGELALSDAINKTIIGNLDVLASGPIPPNPSEIITSVEMANLICKLKKEYDVVIFDSSPIIPVTDAAILSSMLDRTVLVHNAMRSSLMVLQRAKNMLENVNANIDGVVLNQLHSTLFTDTDLPINYYYAKKDKKKR